MRAFKILFKTFAVVSILSIFAVISTAQSKKRPPLSEVTFVVNLHCENCVKKVQDNIPFEKGVKDLKVNLEEKTVWVRYSPDKVSKEELASAIEKLGYEVLGEVKTQENK